MTKPFKFQEKTTNFNLNYFLFNIGKNLFVSN